MTRERTSNGTVPVSILSFSFLLKQEPKVKITISNNETTLASMVFLAIQKTYMILRAMTYKNCNALMLPREAGIEPLNEFS